MQTKLIEARKQAKLTQQQLADMVNINRSHYTHIERGTRIPSLPVAIRIAQALGKNIEDIFLLHDETERHKPTGTEGR